MGGLSFEAKESLVKKRLKTASDNPWRPPCICGNTKNIPYMSVGDMTNNHIKYMCNYCGSVSIYDYRRAMKNYRGPKPTENNNP